MNKVITINLNGNAYQVDESGYNALLAYLDGAQVQLRDNPDRTEVMADLEQAIADKCQKVLGPHKTVVTMAEVEQIINEMGPVDGAAGETGEEQAEKEKKMNEKTEANAPKRLYRIQEGAMFTGVCKGLGAYFNVDATLVRIVFVVLTIATKGLWLLVYALLTLVIPEASTSEERAAARGMPFNAQEVIDSAKKTYSDFRENNKEWKKQFRQQHRQWRQQWRHQWKHQWKQQWQTPSGWWFQNFRPGQQPAGYGTQVMAGVMTPIFGILNLVLFVLAVLAAISYWQTGTILGVGFLPQVDRPVGLLIMFVAFQVITWPLAVARRAAYAAAGFPNQAWPAVWGGISWLACMIFAAWIAYHFVPEVHYIIDNFPDLINDVVRR